MKISENGMNLIKEFEGCILSAYDDYNDKILKKGDTCKGTITIGYGTTNSDRAITGKSIVPGMKISKKTADEWLEKSINKKYCPLVEKYNDIYHFTQSEFDALVSFAYNVGSIDQLTARGTRCRATIIEKMGKYNKANGRVLPGLSRRRQAEVELFTKKRLYTKRMPVIPLRGYLDSESHGRQVQRLQKYMNWYFGTDFKTDGFWRKELTAQVNNFKREYNMACNGRFGKKCLEYAKKVKR